MDKTKCCSKCGNVKTLAEFTPDCKRRSGFRSTCHSCQREATRLWRINHPDARCAHYEKNKEHVLAQNAAWQASNKERYRAIRVAHYQNNKEHVAAVTKAYREANPDLYAAAFAKRRASRRQATPSWADFDKIAAVYILAADLTALTGQPHEVDHIVPLQSRWVCGLHVHYNLQVITGQANRGKSNRRWPDMGALSEMKH